MQAIPVNLSYGKYTSQSQRRSSEPHLYPYNTARSQPHTPHYHRGLSHPQHPSITPNPQHSLSIDVTPSKLVSSATSIPRVLTRLGIGALASTPNTHESNSKANAPPKPNRNLYRRRILIPKTPSSHHNHRRHPLTKAPNKSSPVLSSRTRSKKHRMRSQSFSISQTYSQNRSKAHSRVIPPTHYSPSTTHTHHSLEITPPPLHISTPNCKIRTRPRSLSQHCHIATERESEEETRTIEINNGKSVLFSSWFSGGDGASKSIATATEDEEAEEEEAIHLNESDIESAIQCMNDVHSSLSSTDSNRNQSSDMGVIEESKSNATFTLGLKPPRNYARAPEEKPPQEDKEEMISFRDFLAQENRKALRREVVNAENRSRRDRKEDDRWKMDKFYILKGNTKKIDYGLPEGPYTLYKFVITFNHRRLKLQKSDGDIDDIEKSTSHWSIRKRYSDFVRFNHKLMAQMKGTKLPKLPPKTFKKNFSSSFVAHRHDALLEYLNQIVSIEQVSGCVTLLTFLGAVNNHTLRYNDRLLESRMTLSIYITNYADTGDVLLFETKSYIAASLRSVTSSDYDHVALVYRDMDGTHECHEGKDRMNGLYLVESTVDGVRTYPLKNRLKQWSILCPQIVVRRLKLLKEGVQQRKADEWSSSSLGSLLKEAKYTKYDYTHKREAFYRKATQFVDKVNGLDYAIWSNVLRLSDVPFEKQKSFFCSQLVTAFFKFMQLLPQNVKTNRILPGHYAHDIANNIKLPFIDSLLTNETLLLFKLPAVGAAKHKIYRY